jgi:hypothetical protein
MFKLSETDFFISMPVDLKFTVVLTVIIRRSVNYILLVAQFNSDRQFFHHASAVN